MQRVILLLIFQFNHYALLFNKPKLNFMHSKKILSLLFVATTFCSSQESSKIHEQSQPALEPKEQKTKHVDSDKTIGLKPEYFDLKTLPISKSVSFYEFQPKNNVGLGILKQGYSFNLTSWVRTEDFGIKCVFMTSKAPEKILDTVSEEDYIKFLRSEISDIIPSIFKDKNIVNSVLKAIMSSNYDYYPKTKSYVLQAEHSDYDYISINVERMFFKDLYISIVAGGTDTSW